MPLSPMKRSMIPRVGRGQGELMARLAEAAATSGYPRGVPLPKIHPGRPPLADAPPVSPAIACLRQADRGDGKGSLECVSNR